MRRRDLLTASASALLAHAQSRLRIGFLGASHSHAPDKLRIAMTSPDWEFAGLWEPNTALAESFRTKGAPLRDKAALLNDASIQVLAIESDVKSHEALALEALRAGKHIHVEKPPSDNMSGMRRLVDEARKRSRLMQMGYMWRQHPGFAKLLEAARSGWLGDIYMVRGTMNTLIDAERRKDWALFHGGQMFEQGGHLIDPLIRLLGKPTKITPFLRHHGNFPDGLFDNTHAVFEWPRAMATVTSSVLQPGATAHRTFEVWGSQGNAVLRPIEGPPRLVIDLTAPAGPYKKGTQEVALAKYERYVDGFTELAAAIRANKALPVTLEQELDIQEALLKASLMYS